MNASVIQSPLRINKPLKQPQGILILIRAVMLGKGMSSCYFPQSKPSPEDTSNSDSGKIQASALCRLLFFCNETNCSLKEGQ